MNGCAKEPESASESSGKYVPPYIYLQNLAGNYSVNSWGDDEMGFH
jgi:hypothetical protein